MPRQEIIELIVKTDKAVSQVESLQSEIKDLKNEIKISTDKNYSDGCLYSAQYHFQTTGFYQYHIIAWDGVTSIRNPAVTNYTL